MAMRTFSPRHNEFIHVLTIPSLTFCCSIIGKAGEVDKSGICAATRTIASQWLTRRLVNSPKAQVAHRLEAEVVAFTLLVLVIMKRAELGLLEVLGF